MAIHVTIVKRIHSHSVIFVLGVDSILARKDDNKTDGIGLVSNNKLIW